MAAISQLEDSLNDIFGKSAPALPEGGRKFLVDVAPWLSLLGGILSVWTAWNLWHWAHIADSYIDYANRISALYGNGAVVGSRLSLGIWLSMAVVVVQGVLMLMAFPKLRERSKKGWDLLFYSTLVGIVYGVIVMFTNYGNPGSLVGALIGAAISFYLLFQIRGHYMGKAASKPTDKPKE
ncbi:hypothetical protein KDA23_05780 [Candidatus Saccharibacteria bacterium]|nr:hypothetical protein [Candidatus Saccharibacteria bacterium]